MKTLRNIMFGLTALLLATAAQAQETRVKASVPFNFVLGDRAYPAGDYTLNSVNGGGSIIQIRNIQDTAMTNLQSSIACVKNAPSQETKLVFMRLGDTYVLSQVWVAGYDSGREFPRSKAVMQLTQNTEKPELVMVAANITH